MYFSNDSAEEYEHLMVCITVIGVKLCGVCCDFYFIFSFWTKTFLKNVQVSLWPEHRKFGVVLVCHRTGCAAPLFHTRVMWANFMHFVNLGFANH